MKKYWLTIIMLFCINTAMQAQQGFTLAEKPAQKQVDVLYNGKLLTAYCYYDSIKKHTLWPVNTVDGITVTRGFPLQPLPGERTDHPHHIGLWMNYESVNGLDFWNHSTAIPFEKRNQYGTIVHQQVLSKSSSKDSATLRIVANWLRPDGHVLLKETTGYTFKVVDKTFFFDRTTTLAANDLPVVFKDVKDGFIAIRVARQLELPSTQADVFVDAKGNQTAVPAINNEGVTGDYLTAEGATGDAAWSTKGVWTALNGKKDGRNVGIGIIDHPQNVGYPAYRHARGYGLFAINPLGRKVFSNGKEDLEFSLQPGASVTFRYRVVIASGKALDAAAMNALANAFAAQK